ncbi:Formate/nitrite transporter [Aulographum hederae CBS 113979]|uniref:Formate/nitrite transporter n=1 Tax=Aulographum hederae CBS 113979 TaxID=1176131 RepID=A0A6G1GVH7_9PEZI|nr:Formate/nitrite transporter [Aulographum hederae CBS 113979]
MSVHNAYNQKETMELVSRTGVLKANMRLDKMFLSSVSAGFLLSFACATLLSTNTAPWFQQNAPGLIRTIGALVFPYGLTIVTLTGSDLCTGSFMFTTVSVLHGRLGFRKMLLHWVATFWGNLAGSLFVVAVIAGYGDVFRSSLYRQEVIAFATAKQLAPQWHMIFLRGIGANWLVCLACMLGLSGREFVGKVVGIWIPTFAFVSLGLDHVVANMFFIPIAIFEGAPGISVGLYIWKGIIPALLGNIIGGGLFVGTLYWYLHLHGQPSIEIDGSEYESDGIYVRRDAINPRSGRSLKDEEVGAPSFSASERDMRAD